ncbi:MAG: DEAD/DEAH box helicase [Candidatus Syntropharchaeia archaeon]
MILDDRIRRAFKFKNFTKPQREAIPHILEGKNVLLIAPTGSGKTEAALLPIFHFILNSERKGISAIYITPLRALNRDMLSRLEYWGEVLGIDIQVRHGDTDSYHRRKQALKPPDILITTPETIQAILIGKRMRENLKNVRYVIVDEIHELAESKRGLQLSIALERLAQIAGEFQRIGLSATVGSPKEIGAFLVGCGRDVEIIDVSFSKPISFRVISPEDEIAEIKRILSEYKSTLIFVNTRQTAEALGSRMRLVERDVGVHHGSLSKETRIEAENSFKEGKIRGLICTSSMELGIDIGDVELVVQYMSPRQVTRLLQRVGRAGHSAEEVSRGVVIATNPDDICESWAIVKNAMDGKIEPIEIRENSLDTIVNQVCGILISEEMEFERIYNLIRRAYPFRNLKEEDLREILDQMKDQKLLRSYKKFSRSKRTRKYLVENLSMIPDEKKYEIFDVVGRKAVGSLDEAFVLNFAHLGATFVTGGDIWRVVDVEENKLVVEPVENPEAEIPNWIGEEIPVPFEIAQEVGRIRKKISNLILNGKSEGFIWKEIKKYCETDFDSVKKVVDFIRKQIEGGYPIPTEDTITIEVDGSSAVINACFGHKTNETLGRVITSLLGAKFGGSVAMKCDPYRIKIEASKRLSGELIRDIILSIEGDFVAPIIEMTLKNSTLFRWKFIQVARKFGVLERDVDYEKFSIEKLLDVYRDTPIYRETLQDIFSEKLEVERTSEILKKIKSGEIKMIFSKKSPIGMSGTTGKELLAPENADRSVILALKNRIMNDRILLFCVHCKKWKSKRKVKNVPEEIVCPVCGSKMVAALKPWEEEEIELVKKKHRTKTEKEKIKRIYRNANLVLSHGIPAVIALACRGVGPETASRIIGKLRDDEEEFYRDIMRVERNYVVTRRFWD